MCIGTHLTPSLFGPWLDTFTRSTPRFAANPQGRSRLAQFKQTQVNFMNGQENEYQQKFNDWYAHTEEYVRNNPTQAVLSAVGAGFVLRLLPLGALVSALVRLALFALRPAIFIYGAVTLFKHFQEGRAEQQ